ncbi:RNase H domain-containing protein [Trichonephila clavipes]|nr:RNase H domain-containing protein [Trichonephila clavipes]
MEINNEIERKFEKKDEHETFETEGRLLNDTLTTPSRRIYSQKRNEHSRSGSGIYTKSQNYSSHTKLRSSDDCSVFLSELIAVDTFLKDALSIPGPKSIWIISVRRSAIQHLSNLHREGNNTRVAILDKLKRILSFREIQLQWVPSHINIAGNEIADALAKDGAAQPTMYSAHLTYSELHCTYINNKQSTVSPVQHWYEAKRPGVFLSLQCSRQEQTILIRFRSGWQQSFSDLC